MPALAQILEDHLQHRSTVPHRGSAYYVLTKCADSLDDYFNSLRVTTPFLYALILRLEKPEGCEEDLWADDPRDDLSRLANLCAPFLRTVQAPASPALLLGAWLADQLPHPVPGLSYDQLLECYAALWVLDQRLPRNVDANAKLREHITREQEDVERRQA
ncbi:MAG: hypothetical protein ACOYBJ_02015 [Patescibacteria group bacterium]|jgi:hypothetical protein